MLRGVSSLLLILGCVACNAVSATDEPAALRDRLDRTLCSSSMLDDVVQKLKAENIQYFENQARGVLTAKRSFGDEKLVSSAVVIEIVFSSDRVVRECKVRVVHTGP